MESLCYLTLWAFFLCSLPLGFFIQCSKAKKQKAELVGDQLNNSNNQMATTPTAPSRNSNQNPVPAAVAQPEKEPDSFDHRRPEVREARRSDEIRQKGPVPKNRDDYKTMPQMLPSSDFDKSIDVAKSTH